MRRNDTQRASADVLPVVPVKDKEITWNGTPVEYGKRGADRSLSTELLT